MLVKSHNFLSKTKCEFDLIGFIKNIKSSEMPYLFSAIERIDDQIEQYKVEKTKLKVDTTNIHQNTPPDTSPCPSPFCDTPSPTL